MKKIAKKLTAMAIVAVMMLGLLPPFVGEVFATPQGPTTDQNMVPQAGRYTLTLNWNRPPIVGSPHNTQPGLINEANPYAFPSTGSFFWDVMDGVTRPPQVADGGAQWYRIMFSRHTTATNLQVPGEDNIQHVAGLPRQTRTISLPHTESGAVYAFEVVPFHHEYVRTVSTITTPGAPSVRIVTPPSQGTFREVAAANNNLTLFMTDISVLATPRDGRIDVTWDRPILNGIGVFDYWAVSIRNVQTNAWEHVAVPESELNLVRGGRGLSYSITTDNFPGLTPLTLYHVYIEPVLAPLLPRQLVRSLPVSAPYTFNGMPLHTRSQAEVDYRTEFPVFLDMELTVEPYAPGLIQLTWPSGLEGLNVESLIIFQSPTLEWLEEFRNAEPAQRRDMIGQMRSTTPPGPLIEITGRENISQINRHITEAPDGPMFYMMVFWDDSDPWNIDVFPYPIGFSAPVWFDPGITPLTPTRPLIRNRIRHEPDPPPSLPARPTLTVNWDAFLRNPLNPGESGQVVRNHPYFDGLFLDRMVEYQVFIVDDLQLLNFDPNYPGPVEPFLSRSFLGLTEESNFILHHHHENPRYSFTYELSGINQYFTSVAGVPTLVNGISLNKIYYVKVVAWQIALIDGEFQRTNQPHAYAVSSHFVPAYELYAHPRMMSKPPLRVRDREDQPGVPDVGIDHIAVEWDLMYFEAFDPSTTSPTHLSWHTRLAFSPETGNFYFGDNIRPTVHRVIELIPSNPYMRAHVGDFRNIANRDASAVSAVKHQVYAAIRAAFWGNAAGGPDDLEALLPIRFIDYTHPTPPAQFALNWMPYHEMRATYGNMMGYIDNNLRPWIMGRPGPMGTIDPNHPYRMFLEITGLLPDTPYVIALWPFIIDPGNDVILPAFEPANIVAATVSDPPDVIVVPTVPTLFPIAEGPTWLTVGWFSASLLDYELYLGDLMLKFPLDYDIGPTAPYPVTLTREFIRENVVETQRFNPISGAYERFLEFTFHHLFPETPYYIWIRAFSGELASDFGSPINMRTTEMEPPPPPTGLGFIGTNNLRTINATRPGDEIFPLDIDNVMLEWTRAFTDTLSTIPRYVVAPTDGEITRPLLDVDLYGAWQTLDTVITRFIGLEPNSPYYVRVLTRLTLTELSIGNSISEFQYVIQFSLSQDFIDFIEVIIPATITGGQEGQRFLQRDSVWTPFIRIFTMPWDGEFDGDRIPDTYPLPDDDFELIWDHYTQTLTWRFRSDQVDQDGHRDNRVDMRFISRLIDSRASNFTIDLSRYGRYSDIIPRNRVVEMPFTIYTAMADRDISLTLIMGDTTYVLPGGYLELPEVYAMRGYGFGATIRITAEDNPQPLPSIDTLTTTHAVLPSALSIDVSAGTHSVSLTRTPRPFTVTQRAMNPRMMLDGNSAGFQATRGTFAWNIGDYSINPTAGSITQTSNEIGTFAILTRIAPVSVDPMDRAALDAFESVNRHIVFEGMTHFNPSAHITSGQLNKLVAALANGDRSVDLDAALTSDEHNALSRSGLMVPASEQIMRQEAVTMLVRLYETLTRQRIPDPTPLVQTQHLEIALAAPHLQRYLLKAVDLGFFENRPGAVRPLEPVTMGELIDFVDMVIRYTR